MKTWTLLLAICISATAVFSQAESDKPQTDIISVDELRGAESLADLSDRKLDWDAVENAEITYIRAGETNLTIMPIRSARFPEKIRELFSDPSVGDRIYIDNIRIPQDDGSTIVTNMNLTVK